MAPIFQNSRAFMCKISFSSASNKLVCFDPTKAKSINHYAFICFICFIVSIYLKEKESPTGKEVSKRKKTNERESRRRSMGTMKAKLFVARQWIPFLWKQASIPSKHMYYSRTRRKRVLFKHTKTRLSSPSLAYWYPLRSYANENEVKSRQVVAKIPFGSY